MERKSLQAYLVRDWHLIAATKAGWWLALNPAQKLRIADELRKQAIAQDKDWPSEQDRKEDLEAHIRLAATLAEASARRAAR